MRLEVLAAAGETRPTVIGGEHEEGVERDRDERERTIEREAAHVRLDEAYRDARTAGVGLGALQHRGRSVDADDLVTILRDRHRDAARSDAELEHRAAGHLRETAVPIDAGILEPSVQVVERGETLVLGGRSRPAVPVNDVGHRTPPVRG